MEYMTEKGLQAKAQTYREFVFLSAGPVGDHALIIDDANRFFESTRIPSTIIMKHPNPFLRDMAIPYYDHISYIGFVGWKGKLTTFLFALTSIWKKRCYVLVLPIPPPRYLKAFAYYIRFLTRSRIIALDSPCGYNLPGGPFSSAQFVGKKNYIPANVDTELYYEEANRLLVLLGYKPVARKPFLHHVDTPSVLQVNGLVRNEYLVIHMCSSHSDRSFPSDRWNVIIRSLREKLPGVIFVCTGSPADKKFIEESLGDIPRDMIRLVCGVGMQELLTVHAHARLNVTVHTGNAMLINMLHVPTITVNIKGIYMFKYYYNEKGTELVATEGCTCHPLERGCSMVEYKGVEYMACLFNTTNEQVIQAVTSRYGAETYSV
jgi:ADP-heptose:LPS heptosyltransferase